MAKRQTTSGKCELCGQIVGKAAMAKHLAACRKTPGHEVTGPQTRPATLLHLQVEGSYAPGYWLHLDVAANATLDHLDQFLRGIWLECCGHMSQFTFGQQHYVVGEEGVLDGDQTMDVELGQTLKVGDQFTHEYDFGSTTELTLKVIAEGEGRIGKNPVRLLARNEPPLIPCGVCGQPAAHVCTECMYEAKGWLCKACGRKHECGDEMFLPVVNSPRVGVCGYTGE